MLADYYLSQRGDYAESNKLMRQLTDVFEAKNHEGTQIQSDTLFNQDLHSFKMKQDMKKTSTPMLLGTAGKKIFDLDVLT